MIMITLILLSLGLAMDAFAAAVAQGASSRPNRSTALRMSLAFGLAQAIMPLLGWGLGIAFAAVMASVAHWIALALLSILGLRMIKEGLDRHPDQPMKELSLWPLLVVAIATSIDAAVAGITLPSFGAPIVLACAVIGLTTALLTYPGVYLGALVGARIGKWAEVLGGLILIGLGVKIFVAQQYFGG
ncbi:manganese efflux pump MntP family protein [Parasphingorhabdus sp.]|jgi:putative Mn2+ efflux pump MntP|uniref:manganese efflux pump MntP n=1 Tax=Parasphingorhabdus sp. TaxID=2709688 RepID=UPI002B26D968|nr:manganese efflux pump MntP family protein [Parasphingorhabdus sp.]|tara:strand:+ start:873 stop:1433 length:561 start_codon:yes stop_codon:yes gene_type:complete